MATFKCDTFLDLAERLSTDLDEASLRSAISRAYYALFLTARKIAAVTSKRSNAHALTQTYLRDHGATGLAKGLGYMRELRNASDYDETLTVDKETAREALKFARIMQLKLFRMQLSSPAALH